MLTQIKPWGQYTILGSGDGYQIKLIVINPNSRLSLQKHKFRAERWYILEGTPIVTIKGREFPVSPGSAVNIPIGGVHRIGANNETVKFIEIQTGTYFGEDDIERLEDDYERNECEK
jgi:mannose-6-phosphate isomerase-like protein (cupin superfamily)